MIISTKTNEDIGRIAQRNAICITNAGKRGLPAFQTDRLEQVIYVTLGRSGQKSGLSRMLKLPVFTYLIERL